MQSAAWLQWHVCRYSPNQCRGATDLHPGNWDDVCDSSDYASTTNRLKRARACVWARHSALQPLAPALLDADAEAYRRNYTTRQHQQQ